MKQQRGFSGRGVLPEPQGQPGDGGPGEGDLRRRPAGEADRYAGDVIAVLQLRGLSALLDGLEVRVAFGGKEKESLSELSGGQRSLLALSLVLALLLFKPAPMYILDEVDAALDLSHTQNIGRMLRKHFGQSQFIVVSLKEGMFTNANVIFRTKFVDGVSTVTRTVGQIQDEEREREGEKGTLMAWESSSTLQSATGSQRAAGLGMGLGLAR